LEGRFLNQYELVAQLGPGGMGVVYRARDRELGREVAIKLLPPELATDPDRLARLEREARTLAAVNHPGIATLFGLGQAEIDGRPVRFLAMELVEGEDLATRLARVGALGLEETSALGRQIAAALEVAHEAGVVHRDLKPANVRVTPLDRASSSTSGWRSRSASIRAAPQARR
jgi:serine/threonine-protein kinase